MTNTIKTIIADWTKKEQFSGVVSLSKCGETRFEQAYGHADRANKHPNKTDTRFGIASGTKIFTALAIGKLLSRGELTLESKLIDLVPELTQTSPAVTIEHLLNHTSGLFDYLDEELIEDFDTFELPLPGHTLHRCHDYLPMLEGPPKFPASERFAYSNGGYILLGVVVEKISGISYQEFVELEILAPLGLSHTGFYRFDALPPNCATGYLHAEGLESNIYKLPILGAADGGIYSTAADVATLWRALLNGMLLRPSVSEQLLGARTVVDGAESYGWGYWLWQEKDAAAIRYLDGADAGVAFQSKQLPDGTLITIIANRGMEVWPLAVAIEEALV